MTTRTNKRTSHIRRKILAATLGAASLAMVAAGPAGAVPRDYAPVDEPPATTRTLDQAVPPTDENGKKHCGLSTEKGATVYHRHGTTITISTPGYEDQKMKCNDGNWEHVKFEYPGGEAFHYEADLAYVDEAGLLELANAQLQYTATASGGYYAP